MFSGLCVQTTVPIDDPTGLLPAEANDVSRVRINIVLRTCNRRGSLMYGVVIPTMWTELVLLTCASCNFNNKRF